MNEYLIIISLEDRQRDDDDDANEVYMKFLTVACASHLFLEESHGRHGIIGRSACD